MEESKARAGVKCKFCTNVFPRFDDLRIHAAIEHPDMHQAILNWLDRSTSKRLKVYEALAREGMLGNGNSN